VAQPLNSLASTTQWVPCPSRFLRRAGTTNSFSSAAYAARFRNEISVPPALSSSGFVSWNPGYSSTTNHYTCPVCTYDSNGDVTKDGTYTYAWDAYNKLLSVNASGSGCSSAGECITYDALGRMVEVDSGSTKTEILYTQLGKTAYMNGSTFSYGYWPAPGGGTLLMGAGYYLYYQHKDWLGNVRLSSQANASPNHVIGDYAYAPYGEKYDIFGSTAQNQTMFTGDTQDVLAGIYDTPNRELQGSQQGRWLSPDPAGTGWNQYAYGTNPNSEIDPSGLECLIDCDDPSGWGGIDGGSGYGGTDGLSGNSCDPTDDPNCIFNPITPPGGLPGPIGGSGTGGSGTGGGIGGQGIFPGQDCAGCFPLGPDPLQILQAILSGNLAGALQGLGVFPPINCLPICNYTTLPNGTVVGQWPGEAICSPGFPCIYWNPNTQIWGDDPPLNQNATTIFSNVANSFPDSLNANPSWNDKQCTFFDWTSAGMGFVALPNAANPVGDILGIAAAGVWVVGKLGNC